MLKAVGVVALLTSICSHPVLGQIVLQGSQDPDRCYKIETVAPNLKLNKPTHVFGSILDQISAPLKDSRVELRAYISQRKQVTVKTVTTDGNGRFDLGIVAAGQYRLLASPTRGFEQPSTLKCAEGRACDLKIVLRVKETDQGDSICPVR